MSKQMQGCPSCGRRAVVEIVYGLPGPELMAAALRGEVRIRGCCISSENPTHACKSCDHEWIAEGARTPDI